MGHRLARVAVALVLVLSGVVAGGSAAAQPSGSETVSFGDRMFTPVTPARVLDTRAGVGAAPAPVGARRSVDVVVTGRGGVPASDVGAVVLNVTATEPTASTFVTVFPAGEPVPTASNLNVLAGQTVPNLVIAKVGAGGKVSLYNNSGTVHLIADVLGWIADGADYTGLSPSRLLDTRTGTPVGPRGSIDLRVTGRGGVPADGVGAVVLNVTGTAPTADTFVTVYPAGEPVPLASNLNLTAGQTAPNLVIAKVGAGGKVSLLNNAGGTHLVADVLGWLAAGSDYAPLSPSRLLDTRTGGAVGPGESIDLPVTGVGGVPADGVGAVVLNLTGTAPTASTFVTAYPAGEALPVASNLNLLAGQTRPNLVIAKVGADGRISLYNRAGRTHLIADVLGWISTGVSATVDKPADTEVVDTDRVQAIDDGELTVSGAAPAVGDIVFVPPDAGQPTGLLGRVTAVEGTGGGTRVSTTPVRLDEAFPSGSVTGVVSTTPGPATSIAGRAAAGPVSVDCGGRPLQVDVNLAVEARVVIDMAWSAGRLDRMSVTTEAGITGSVGVTAGFSAECDFPVGPTLVMAPIWGFVPKLSPVVHVEFAAGVTLTAQVDASVRFGAVYGDGAGVRWVREADVDGSFTPPGGAASARLRVGFGPTLQLALANLAGPSFSAGVFVETTLAPAANPWWTTDAGAYLEASLDIDLWFLRASYTLARADFLRFRLSQASSGWAGPRLAGGQLTAAQRGLPYDVALTAQGGAAPLTYGVAAGSLPPGLALTGTHITGTPTEVGRRTVTVQVRDAQGRTARADLTIPVLGPGGAGTLPLPGAPEPREFTYSSAGNPSIDDLGPSGETLMCEWFTGTVPVAHYLHRDGSRSAAVRDLCFATPLWPGRSVQSRQRAWSADGWSYTAYYDGQHQEVLGIRAYGPDGQPRWTFPTARPNLIHLTPDRADVLVYVGSTLSVLDAKTGVVRYTISWPDDSIFGQLRGVTDDRIILGSAAAFDRADGSLAEDHPLLSDAVRPQVAPSREGSVILAEAFNNNLTQQGEPCGSGVTRGTAAGQTWRVAVPAAFGSCVVQGINTDGIGGAYLLQVEAGTHHAAFTRVDENGHIAWTRRVDGFVGRNTYTGLNAGDGDFVVDARGRLAYTVARDQPCTGENGEQAMCASTQLVVLAADGSVLLDRTFAKYGWSIGQGTLVGGFGQLFLQLHHERPGGETRGEIRGIPVPFDGDWATTRQHRSQP
jgi:hypothetical protein